MSSIKILPELELFQPPDFPFLVFAQNSRSTNWGKIEVPEETDIPDDFDFSKMLFKRVITPFSEQHTEVDHTVSNYKNDKELYHRLTPILVQLEDGQETDINWNFDPSSKYGPPKWKNFFPSCGGNRQSPMELSSCQNATQMSRLRLTEMNTRPTEVSITNTGHSSKFFSPSSCGSSTN